MSETRNLWILVLLAPFAWAVHLQTCYSLHAAACESDSRVLLWLASIVLLLVVLMAAWRAWTMWQSMPDPYAGGAAGHSEDEEPRSRARARFMAASAFFGSCFFALIILGQTIPTVILRPCD